MPRLQTNKTKSIVGLDLEAASLAAVEVQHNGGPRVTGFGVGTVPPGAFRDGEVSDPEALGAALKDLFSQHKLSKQVRVGVANQRVVVRTLRLPLIADHNELETAIRFQAQDHIPMPLEQAVFDWQVVSRRPGDEGGQLEVVAVAARRDMLAKLLDAIRRAGLRPVGIDVAAFGMLRALAPRAAPSAAAEEQGAKLYCNLGDVTNLAVARGSTCLFTRISPFGVEGVAQRLAERRQLTLDHARGWLVHVGLDRPAEEIEGEREIVTAAREALEEGAAKLTDELRLSLDFYAAQEGAVRVEGVVACGPGTTVPGLVGRLEQALALPCELGRPAGLGHLPDDDAARLTTSYGLALEE